MAGYFPSSDHRRLRYPNIYGKAIRQNSNKKGDNHGHHHRTWWKPNTGINNHCQFQRHTADPPLIGVIKSTTYSPLSLSISHRVVLEPWPHKHTNSNHQLEHSELGGKERKKKKKTPLTRHKKHKKHTDGNDNMKSIPNNKLPHHLRTRSGGAEARNFRQNIVKSGEITPRAKRLHQSPDPTVAEAKSRTKPKEQRKGYRFSSINLISIHFCSSRTPEAFAPLVTSINSDFILFTHSFVHTIL